MKKIKCAIAGLAALLLLVPLFTLGEEKILIPKKIPEPTVAQLVAAIAPAFGQDPQLIGRIIQCESGGVVAIHDGGRGVGVTGIQSATFALWLPLYLKDAGATLDYGSTADQIRMMSWAFSKGEGYRRQWTTYVALRNGGEYSFFSRILGRQVTAKCK